MSGNEESAAEVWTKLVNLGEGPGKALWNEASYCGHAGQAHYLLGNWPKARELLEKGIELRGEQVPTLTGGPRWWYLTMTLHQLGEVELARSYYDQLVAQFDENRSRESSRHRGTNHRNRGNSQVGCRACTHHTADSLGAWRALKLLKFDAEPVRCRCPNWDQ